MSPNQYGDKEAHTPSVEHGQYNDSTLHFNITTPGVESNKGDEDIPLDKHGRPMVKFVWWRMSRKKRLCIIIGLILLLIGIALLLIFLVIIPAIIRNYMDKVVLTINYMDVTDIPNDSEIDVTFSVNLQHDVPVSASTDEVTASLIYGGEVFGTAAVEGQRIKSGRQNYNLTMNTTMVISDMDAFNAMAEAMMQDDTVPITISADIDAHALGLSFNNLDFKRTLSLVGFDNFAELDVEVQHIDLSGCSDGVYDMDVNASVNNPSTMGLQGIGALNMSVYYNSSYLGYAYSLKPELGMPRGVSNQTFHVVMSETSSALKGVINGFLGGSSIEVDVRGDNPYSTEHVQFKEAMSKVSMTVEYADGLDKVVFNTSCCCGTGMPWFSSNLHCVSSFRRASSISVSVSRISRSSDRVLALQDAGALDDEACVGDAATAGRQAAAGSLLRVRALYPSRFPHRVNMVLKEDVPKLGFRGDEVSVKAGYARNFLYPEKLAVYATNANREKFKVDKESVDETLLEKEHELEAIIDGLSNIEVVFKRHTAAKTEVKLHSEVNAQNISDMLEKQHGLIVGVARIDLPTPIKTLGEHTVKVRVDDAIEEEYAAGAVVSAAEGEAEVEGEGDEKKQKTGPSKKKWVSLAIEVERR
ncbi:hypothetical protein PInf_023727 [Phytophthora infestans]|nr:hypothetical protein PInf_023727 [Phytophthora infestans]